MACHNKGSYRVTTLGVNAFQDELKLLKEAHIHVLPALDNIRNITTIEMLLNTADLRKLIILIKRLSLRKFHEGIISLPIASGHLHCPDR